MFVHTLLLKLPFLIFFILVAMVNTNVEVLASGVGALRQDRILMEFVDHTNSKFLPFSETLQSTYNVCVKQVDFDKLWVDTTDKRSLKHNALSLLEEKILDATKK